MSSPWSRDWRKPQIEARVRLARTLPLQRCAPPETEQEITLQALGRERRNRWDVQASQGQATHATRGRVETSLGGRSEREPRFPSAASAVAGGGVLAALPVLLAEGLLVHAGKLHLPPPGPGVRGRIPDEGHFTAHA